MKRGSLIITAVGISCVLEVLFLFYSYVQTINAPDWLWLVFTALHLVFIVGLGVFFFRWDNRHKASMETRLIQWLTFLIGIPFAALLGGIVCLTVAIVVSSPRNADRLEGVLFLALFACVLYLPLRLILRNRYTFDKHQAVEEWVRERRSESIADRKRRLRAIRIASAIPACLVLCVYAFFFQCLALTFLIAGRPQYDVGGYRITTPASWVIFRPNFGDGDDRGESPVIDSVSGCQPSYRLFSFQRCAAHWSVGQRRNPPRSDLFSLPEISQNERTVQNSHESLRCTESWGYRSEPKNDIDISCEAPSLVHVSYFGPRAQADQFYNFVRSMSWRQNP